MSDVVVVVVVVHYREKDQRFPHRTYVPPLSIHRADERMRISAPLKRVLSIRRGKINKWRCGARCGLRKLPPPSALSPLSLARSLSVAFLLCAVRIPGVHIRENRLRKYARFMHQYRGRAPSPPVPLFCSRLVLLSRSRVRPPGAMRRGAELNGAERCGTVRRSLVRYAAVRPEGGAGPCIIQETYVILNDNRINSR